MLPSRAWPRIAIALVALATSAMSACRDDRNYGVRQSNAANPLATLATHPCIAWQLRELARCGTLAVHENRATHRGHTIDLRVMILPAREATRDPDPILFLTGGPGMAATEMPAYASWALDALRDSRDVVLVDIRGTGGSGALECHLYEDAGRAQPYASPMFPFEKARECAANLGERHDLTQYTTENVADDLDDVRAALGANQLNLFGVSYGSRLALIYMKRHPTRVRSAALAGVNPPEVPVPTAFARGAQRALEQAFATCASDAACHAATPDPRADVATLLARLHEWPAHARLWNWRRLSTEPVTLSARAVAERILAAAYDPDALLRELPVVHQAVLGNYEPLARRMIAGGRQRRANRSEGLMLSVFCAEDVPRIASADTSALAAGTLLGIPHLHELLRACAAWPRAAAVSPGFGSPVQSNVPTLLLSGAFDPVTPPDLADSAARTLPRSVRYLDPRGGHADLNGESRRLIEQLVRSPNRFVSTARH
jgi:pimeloyl-ACP methyl ester carboxylesterase